MKHLLGTLSLVALLVLSGCGNDPTYATAAMMTPHGAEPIMYAGSDLANTVPLAHEGVMEKRTAGGMLQVTLEFENVGKFPENILVKIQFREENGSYIDGDKQTQPLMIEPQEIKPLILMSSSPKAARYSVQVLKHNGGPMPDFE